MKQLTPRLDLALDFAQTAVNRALHEAIACKAADIRFNWLRAAAKALDSARVGEALPDKCTDHEHCVGCAES